MTVVNGIRSPGLNHEATMFRKVSAQELRDRLGEHLDRADLSGQAFVVTRGRRPKAVLLGASQYLALMDRLAAYENGQKPVKRTEPQDKDLVSLEELKRLIK
jgi:prevent-host-death family protein